MDEEKKKRKNKKKKNKQTKANNSVGTEESASSNQNHAADTRGAETHTDTSGVDDDPSRHVTDGTKVATFEEKIKQLQKDKEVHMQKEAILEEKLNQLAKENDSSLLKEARFEEKIMQSQKEISRLMRQEGSHEEKIRQLQMEKDVYLQKEAEFEMKIVQLQSEKSTWLQKEAGFEKRISELVDEMEYLNSKRVSLEEKAKEMDMETENRVQKKVGLEERISQLVDEVEYLNAMRVSLEEKVKEIEKERDNWVQKEKSFREIISSLSGDNAHLEAQVKEVEELRITIVQENQLLKENIRSLQTQVHNLEKSSTLSYSPTASKMNTHENGDLNSELVAMQALVDKLVSENTELVEKVNNLYVELGRKGSLPEVSSSFGYDVITRSSAAPHVANELALGSDRTLGAVREYEVDHATKPKSISSDAAPQSSERLQSLEDAINKAEMRDQEHVANTDSSVVVNSSEIESDEIVQIPLDENEIQPADLEAAANLDQDDEEVPLTNAPLIGAPFRLISFFARYVSGADLVEKNSATSNR